MLLAAKLSIAWLTLRKYTLLSSQSLIVATAAHDSLSFIQNHTWNPRLMGPLIC